MYLMIFNGNIHRCSNKLEIVQKRASLVLYSSEKPIRKYWHIFCCSKHRI